MSYETIGGTYTKGAVMITSPNAATATTVRCHFLPGLKGGVRPVTVVRFVGVDDSTLSVEQLRLICNYLNRRKSLVATPYCVAGPFLSLYVDWHDPRPFAQDLLLEIIRKAAATVSVVVDPS